MCHRLLRDARFYRQLLTIDADLAAQARACGCSLCRSVLHAANYPRKPRGAPEGLGADFDRRHSFCCSDGDCRKRLTPVSVRFLDRRVYLSVMVVLAAVLTEGLSPRRTRTLCSELGVDRRTLERWRQWWREEVPRTDFWADLRGRLDRPPERTSLPASLFERVSGEDHAERLLLFLRLIDPLSHSRLMDARSVRAA